jgi:hypothetical protein
MNELKFLEVRDRGTFIPVVAYKLTSDTIDGIYLIRRAGFSMCNPSIVMTALHDMMSNYDIYGWENSSRTRHVAHDYITKHFDELTTGDVIDVEYILGETATKKHSERLSDLYE